MTTQRSNTAIRNCRFAFRCDKEWQDLTETTFPKVRFCGDCERDVFLCTTDAQLAEAIRLNRCVALVQNRSTKDAPSPGDGDSLLVGLPATRYGD